MADYTVKLLWNATLWVTAASTIVSAVFVLHALYVKRRAYRSADSVKMVLLPCMEPVLWFATFMFFVRSLVLCPWGYPEPPTWFFNAQYTETTVDVGDTLAYFFFWFTFETIADGLPLLFIGEWLSVQNVRRSLIGAVAVSLVLAAITTIGFDHELFGLSTNGQKVFDYIFLLLPVVFYLTLGFGCIPRRSTIVPYCLYSVTWRILLCIAVTGDKPASWMGVAIHVLVSASLPFVLYGSMANDASWWRNIGQTAMRRRSRARGSTATSDSSLNAPLNTGYGAIHQQFQTLVEGEVATIIDFPNLAIKKSIRYLLGQGTSSQVYSAHHKGAPVAVKVFNPKRLSQDDVEAIIGETVVCSSLSHPNIVQFLGISIAPPCVYLVFELCSCRSLAQCLRDQAEPSSEHWDDEIRMGLCRDAAAAVAYIHDMGIIHRDIKSANFMLHSSAEGMRLKLGDFGESTTLSREPGNDDLFKPAGTPAWMAPEMLVGLQQRTSLAPTLAGDIYSLGVVLWEIFTQEEPYAGLSRVACTSAVLGGAKLNHNDERIPAGVRPILEQCWNSKPAERPSADEVLQLLRGL